MNFIALLCTTFLCKFGNIYQFFLLNILNSCVKAVWNGLSRKFLAISYHYFESRYEINSNIDTFTPLIVSSMYALLNILQSQINWNISLLIYNESFTESDTEIAFEKSIKIAFFCVCMFFSISICVRGSTVDI